MRHRIRVITFSWMTGAFLVPGPAFGAETGLPAKAKVQIAKENEGRQATVHRTTAPTVAPQTTVSQTESKVADGASVDRSIPQEDQKTSEGIPQVVGIPPSASSESEPRKPPQHVISFSWMTGALFAPVPAFDGENKVTTYLYKEDMARRPLALQESKVADGASVDRSLPQEDHKTSEGTPQVVGVPPAVSSDSKIKPPAVAPIFEESGVLTPSRTIVLEPSFEYINSSSNRVALSGYTVIPSLTVGLIDVRNVTSNTFLCALTTRYGATSRVELNAKVPYVYRSDSTASQPANTQGQSIPPSVFTADGNGIGDIEFGARYQINQPKSEGPFFIAGLRIKSATGKDPFEVGTNSNVTGPGGEPLQTELPTGSGFWAFQPTLTVLFTSDPAAFFGTVSYMWNKDRNVSGVEFDPGDTIGFNLGVGVALNEKASFSLGYDHVVLGKTKRDNVDLPGTIVTHIGSLLIGCSYQLSKTANLNFSIGVGVTPAASNVQLGLRVPISFLLGGE